MKIAVLLFFLLVSSSSVFGLTHLQCTFNNSDICAEFNRLGKRCALSSIDSQIYYMRKLMGEFETYLVTETGKKYGLVFPADLRH